MKRYTILTDPAAIVKEDSNGIWVKHEDVYNEYGEKCQCCGEMGHDRRTLSMACGYAMNELNVPFVEKDFENVPSFGKSFFTLKVCKDCRSRWMHTIEDWFKQGGASGERRTY